MKKTIALLMALVMMLSLAACGEKAPEGPVDTSASVEEETEDNSRDPITLKQSLKDVPDYTFDHEPTIDELRHTAVRAMEDILTIEWYTTENFSIKTSVSEREYKSGIHYAGVPYTGANTTIWGFLSYYNKNTGRLRIEEVENGDVNEALGSSCTGTTGYSLLSVCTSIGGLLQCYYVVPKNGYLPVGDYEVDPTLDRWGYGTNTRDIIEKYGAEKICECYAQVLPGDILNWQNEATVKMGHSQMVAEPAHVEYTADGKIDPNNSYIIVDDQWVGFYDGTNEAGETITYSGHLREKETFAELLEKTFLPFTTAEFKGEKAYEAAEVKIAGGKTVASKSDLTGATLNSNYPLALLNLTATDKNGKCTEIAEVIFDRKSLQDGTARNYKLRDVAGSLTRKSKELAPGDYTIAVNCKVTNGAEFTPITFTHTVE